MYILIECYRLPFTLNRSQALNYWSFYQGLLFISRSRHMQYIFYLNIVNQQLHLLFDDLKRIAEYAKYERSKLNSDTQSTYNRFLCRRLILAREFYSLIFEISSNINDAFGWSHLVNLTHGFVQILVDSYWLYWNTDNQVNINFGGKNH